MALDEVRERHAWPRAVANVPVTKSAAGADRVKGDEPPGMDFLIVVGIGLVVALIAHLLNKKRKEAIRAYASQRGWQYRPQDPALVHRWSSPPFGVGNSRRAAEVLTGEFHGEQAVSFDYRYSTVDTYLQLCNKAFTCPSKRFL